MKNQKPKKVIIKQKDLYKERPIFRNGKWVMAYNKNARCD